MRNEKIGYKIREHSTAKVPIIIVVGKKEAENQTLSLRKLGNNKTETFKIDDILEQLLKEKMSPIDIY